uniref:Splicing regulatory glutamine/lysine-rich protein 1 n=1 Tax=Lygus hesperus TaxID=30085 RepID=A0A0A9WGU2_LYGHE
MYIGNLSKLITMKHLKIYFSNCGTILFARIAEGNSRFGFIEFIDKQSAINAIKFHGTILLDRALVVRPSNNSITKSPSEQLQIKELLARIAAENKEKLRADEVLERLRLKSAQIDQRMQSRLAKDRNNLVVDEKGTQSKYSHERLPDASQDVGPKYSPSRSRDMIMDKSHERPNDAVASSSRSSVHRESRLYRDKGDRVSNRSTYSRERYHYEREEYERRREREWYR